MDYALIPFALRKADGHIVDVGEVQQGLACGCICPSCQSPLIARKGDIKAWHFAHVSRADEGDTHSDCDFSWAVSVRLMARQVLREGVRLELPAYEDTIEISARWGHATQHGYNVTPAQTLDVPPSEIDAKFGNTLVDVLSQVDGGAFVIYITHAGRQLPDTLLTPPAPCAGVISIGLTELIFSDTKLREGQSYRQMLTAFLSSNIPSKRWVFHPHAARRRQMELEALRARPIQRPAPPSPATRYDETRWSRPATPTPVPPPSSYRDIPPVPGDTLRYVCVKCDFRWGDQTGGKVPCPRCGSERMVTYIRD